VRIEEFTLERLQSLHENEVELNLSDSGVHPLTLEELFDADARAELARVPLGYGWTDGDPALRAAIAALYPGRTAEQVLVTNGSAEANFLLAMTLVEPGDEVVMVTPNYLQLRGWIRALGATVREVQLDAARGWSLDPAAVEAALTARTRLVTLCHPNNPTGSVLSAEVRDALVELTARRGVALHVDEVYTGCEFDGEETPSFARSPHVIVTNGLSKAMALPGLRIGWLCGPAAELREAWARKDYTSITTGALSEAIARRVLEPAFRARILARSRAWLADNRALLLAWVAATPGVSIVPPRAGGMAFLAYDAPIGSTALAERLRTEASTLVVPGDAYGLDGYLRVGIGAPRATLEAGLERLGTMLAGLR
jgi:aspartate/methionine/tyrosine aminotransferase